MKYLYRVLLLIFCIIVGWLSLRMVKLFYAQPQISDHSKLTASLGKKNLDIEVVNSTDSIAQGLSGREELGSDGMLFLLTQTSVPTFWMKEMRFDLDLIWLRNYQVVDITKNVPHPNPETPLNQLPIYSPKTPANMVLEVNAGQTTVWDIQIGDKLSFH